MIYSGAEVKFAPLFVYNSTKKFCIFFGNAYNGSTYNKSKGDQLWIKFWENTSHMFMQ